MTKIITKQNSPNNDPHSVETYDLSHNLVDLYWFLQVVDAGSFSGAANNHGMSKSNLSRRLSQLESRLGVQLLHRNSRFLTLTSIGTTVYRHTLDMISAAQHITDSVQHALDIPSGKINIILPAILNYWLMPILLDFKNTYQDIQLNIQTADTTQELHSQSIDLALSVFAPPVQSEHIVVRPLATLSLVNVISTRFKNTENPTQIQINHPGSSVNSKNNNSLQVDNYLIALDAVTAGFGYACLPLCVCNTAIRSGDLKFHDFKEDSQTLFALTQSQHGTTLATRVFLEYLTLSISKSKIKGIIPLAQPNGDTVI